MVFQREPVLNLPTRTKACQWESLKKEIQRTSRTTFLCPTGETTSLSLAACKKYQSDLTSLPFKTFDSLYAGLNRKKQLEAFDVYLWLVLQELHLRSYHRGSCSNEAVRVRRFRLSDS